MSQVVLQAKSRQGRGSADARRVRRIGRIPAVLYGKSGASLSIDLDGREFVNSVKNISESTIVKVEVEGKSYDAFVKDAQRNIVNGSILHVDFYEVEGGRLLRARVSVHIHGTPVGVREGGVLENPLHEIEVECYPKDLPERLDVDISELKVNQSLHVRDIPLAEGVKLLSGADQVVALVKYAKAEAVKEDEAAAAAVPGAVSGAAPAAGAAVPAGGTAAPSGGEKK
ncbi:MAG: 50S ribosomal protein L25 [Treponema sp.]|jgi:large subunit ribosomal protein L25|nr:50S ribosomal protein L25 [Treponema sp.]